MAVTTTAKSADSSSSNSSSTSSRSRSSSSSTTRTKRTRSIRAGTVSSRWLFNHFHVGELVVDARAPDAFARGTVLGAISVPPLDGCQSFADVDTQSSPSSDAARLSPRKRKLRDVVLLADRAQLGDAASWVFTLQQLLADDGLVASVKVLGDCYADFARRYPFYTTGGVASGTGAVVSGEHLVTYPNEIEDGFLYLGNMWQAESPQVIADLGITHVVNASLDVGNVFAGQGVCYHEVKIKDESAADITRFFDSTFLFIHRAKLATSSSLSTTSTAVANGGERAPAPRHRVLVHCTQGISRSATLVIAYLMRTHQWSLARAYNYTRAGRGVILPNDGFLRALLLEERRLLGGNSVAEHELDLLLQGGVPDRPAACDALALRREPSLGAAAPSRALVAVAKRHVRTGRVNCRWLYNQVQAARGIILIDTRAREAFDEDTIPSAISIPPVRDCRSLDDVESGMLSEQRYLFTAKRRKLRDVVLFGETVKSAVDSGYTSTSATSATDGNSSDRNNAWLRQLERLLVADGLVTSVKILFDGFTTFQFRYPFYTTSAMLDEIAFGLTRTRSGTHNLNYPNEILEGFLFLGNMWHAQSKQVIQHLGITHVVNASLDVDNVFAGEGVQYKAVQIKDRPESDIAAFFDSTFEFIESAKRTHHGRVLVHCTQGISRSATLVIMYLMRANNWSLVTAVNFAMASRGVVYPNEGFFRSLMAEEFRLYKGNSVTLDEVDLLLQHQIPDRPVPLESRHHKSENCSQCSKLFSLLEWKHKCSYCRKEFCSKCTSTRLANPEREKLVTGLDEQRKPRRVCDVCVSRLWKINLPRPRLGLQMRNPKCKHLNVNSLATFGKPVCISYFEGTEPQVILDVIKARFEVKSSQIVDVATENGEPVHNLAELPDEATVLVSIGKTGNVHDSSQRLKARGRSHNPTLSPRDRVIRTRFSSEGSVDALSSGAVRATKQPASRNAPDALAANELELRDERFRDMWRLAFPTMGVIERQALLKIRNPAILTDVMLGVSSLSCGSLTIQDFNRRLVDLGYADPDRELVVTLLDKSRRANGF
ncbi:hypothetical protein PybrP1_007923 [[Pythium] brassicae (nom. inval.)]|nr:hypothetical protein PybrP1_007923 [[Pythium] brassicae (nom. inval.)]